MGRQPPVNVRGVKIIRIGLVKGFIVEPILAAKFSYLLFVDIVGR